MRGGSKGILKKNIKHINGHPLLYWVLQASFGSEKISKVFVCTEDEEIRSTTERYKHPKLQVVSRSEKTVKDSSSTESAMLEFADENEFENIFLIQATSPMLTSDYLDEATKVFENGMVDSVLSVAKVRPYLWQSTGNNTIKPVNYNPLKRPRRQDFEPIYRENGAFYLTSKKRLIESRCRISGKIGFVQMPLLSSFEIDEPAEWNLMEYLVKNYRI